MKPLELDPRAATAIDQRAEALLGQVTAIPKETRPAGWEPDIPIAASLTEKDIIGEPDIGLVMPDGRQVAMQFLHNNELYELGGKGYDGVHQLVDVVLKDREIRARVSSGCIEDQIRSWVRKRFRVEISLPFSTYALSQLNELIAEYRVWVPIERFYIQSPFSLGAAEIRVISREFLQSITSTAKYTETREHSEKILSKYQGHGAVVVTCVGEKEKAREVGIRVAEKTLGALALLSPAAFRCNIASAAGLWHSKRANEASTLLFKDDKLASHITGIIGPPPQSHSIDDSRLREFAPILKGLHSLLLAESSNSLTAKIVDALQVYYRAIVAPDAAETLIYVFVGLEMVLLRDGSEAVQENVAMRIAFLTGRSIEERRKIISTVKAGYKLRSAFIHHGSAVRDMEAADELLAVAWRTFVELSQTALKYRDQNDMIRHLDDLRLR